MHPQSSTDYTYSRSTNSTGTYAMYIRKPALRRYQNIGSKIHILVFRATYYTTAVHSTEACSMVWTTAAAARRLMRASFKVKSAYCSPCCLVRAVCCVLSWCGDKNIHAHEKTGVPVLHGTCKALGERKRVPWLLASFRHFEPSEHVLRTSARAHTFTAVFTRASCIPRNRKHEKNPRAEEQKMSTCKKTAFGAW